MKLEKRNGSGPAEPEQEGPPRGKKPVIVYIMVLFIAAFLLMAWSFASHQRSNTEALGRLQSSVAAMQGAQELQEQVIRLQEELAETEKALAGAREETASQKELAQEARESSELLTRKCDAMYYLYALQQQYLLQDLEGCRETIRAMEDGGLAGLLSDGGGAADVICPALRYQQLKEAVEAREEDGK